MPAFFNRHRVIERHGDDAGTREGISCETGGYFEISKVLATGTRFAFSELSCCPSLRLKRCGEIALPTKRPDVTN